MGKGARTKMERLKEKLAEKAAVRSGAESARDIAVRKEQEKVAKVALSIPRGNVDEWRGALVAAVRTLDTVAVPVSALEEAKKVRRVQLLLADLANEIGKRVPSKRTDKVERPDEKPAEKQAEKPAEEPPKEG